MQLRAVAHAERTDLLFVVTDRTLRSVPVGLRPLLRERIALKEFAADAGELLVLFPEKRGLPKRVFVVGAGAATTEAWRTVGGSVSAALKKFRTTQPASRLPAGLKPKELEAFAEGVQLGLWNLKTTQKAPKVKLAETLLIETRIAAASTILRRAGLLASAILDVRRLSNAPASAINPSTLEEEVRTLEKLPGVTVEVWDDAKLAKQRMECIRAVGAGSVHPPRLAIIRMHAPDARRATVLVGKGVCFDSGGYNLKPTGAIEEMFDDMTGAATVIGTIRALAARRSRVPVIALLPLVENLVAGNAYKPGDILTARNGTTIEVNNTDAEGRLILADALALASEWHPKRIIDVATLTGSALVALGDRFNLVLTSDDRLADALIAAGKDADEPLWRLPLHPDYAKWMEGTRADLRNISRVPMLAGAITATEFLRKFVAPGVPYAHIDLAASAQRDVRPPFIEGCNGIGVRMLAAYLQSVR